MKRSNLQIALRRNKHRREWLPFQRSFVDTVGIPLNDSQLVAAQRSVELNCQLLEVIAIKDDSCQLTRVSEQTPEQLNGIVERFCSDCRGDDWILFMSNYHDFDLRMDPSVFARKFQEILKFDRDTIYFFDGSLTTGIGIDYYKSEICGDWRYSIDIWRSQ